MRKAIVLSITITLFIYEYWMASFLSKGMTVVSKYEYSVVDTIFFSKKKDFIWKCIEKTMLQKAVLPLY